MQQRRMQNPYGVFVIAAEEVTNPRVVMRSLYADVEEVLSHNWTITVASELLILSIRMVAMVLIVNDDDEEDFIDEQNQAWCLTYCFASMLAVVSK